MNNFATLNHITITNYHLNIAQFQYFARKMRNLSILFALSCILLVNVSNAHFCSLRP